MFTDCFLRVMSVISIVTIWIRMRPRALVEFMYLFTWCQVRFIGWLKSLLLCLVDVSRLLINSFVCWSALWTLEREREDWGRVGKKRESSLFNPCLAIWIDQPKLITIICEKTCILLTLGTFHCDRCSSVSERQTNTQPMWHYCCNTWIAAGSQAPEDFLSMMWKKIFTA